MRNKVGRSTTLKQGRFIRPVFRVYRRTSRLRAPWNPHQDMITFAQHTSLHRPFRMGGTVDQLSACCLLFIFLTDIYELTFLLLKHAFLHCLFRMGESDYL